jgi:hypothetical protein
MNEQPGPWRVARRALRALALCLTLGFAGTSAAQVTVSIVGDTATATIALPAPGGTYDAVFTIEFDNPRNLTESCLGLSADVLDATEIANIESRLPDALIQSIDPNFPVRVTVEPSPACGLAFDNEVKVEMHTTELTYASFSPYRLFKAPVGQPFFDITSAVVSGSVRARGSSGGFSEFVLVIDEVQDYRDRSFEDFDDLANEIKSPSLTATAQATLEADAALAQAAYEVDDFTQSLAYLDQFEAHLRSLAGTGVPNQWRSTGDLIDDTGEILSIVATLRFNLGRLNGNP